MSKRERSEINIVHVWQVLPRIQRQFDGDTIAFFHVEIAAVFGVVSIDDALHGRTHIYRLVEHQLPKWWICFSLCLGISFWKFFGRLTFLNDVQMQHTDSNYKTIEF